ncbi:7-carboxy-7-deazaguanine synthase [Candidatus Ornithobacterium hominis]|uniref:7-carboxy-7-deazaguanine synthase QueE n=1 Tax=Candidatus Ornithobacterium hominis TaxID=2497989 RepID=UPI0027A4DA58|nr:7-carboxy-7-deazaguanine synthase [Candidatus Ornithobacterium hominis]
MVSKNQELVETGEYLPIMEDFYTLQGEGAHTGKASYFIRIGGCDVGCHWCDVKESWDASKHPITSIKTLIERIPENVKTVVLTGGEPSSYNLYPLTKLLKQRGFKIHMETSGSNEIRGHVDWICLSPKKLQRPVEKVINNAHELKCIIYNQNDFKFAEEYAAKVKESCELFLQPEWSKSKGIVPQIIHYILKNPKWKISIQTHKFLNIP